jgi:heme-degrading monooxygenase HmoA
MSFAHLPEPPYWAVVFSSRRRESGTDDATGSDDGYLLDDGYAAAAARMEQLAAGYAGFLGIESARDGDGFGITVSYWVAPEAIQAWRDDTEHALTRDRGRADWYQHYELRVARVERAYGWDAAD